MVDDKKKLKVAFLLGIFPKTSEAFIINQITSLLDKGIEVTIFSLRKPEEEIIHPSVKDYNLLARTHYINVPRKKFIKGVKALGIITKNLFTHPIALIECFNYRKYGKTVLTLNPLYVASYFLRLKEKFDVIHCHWGQRGIYGACLKEIGIPGKLITSFHGADALNFPHKHGKNIYDFLFKRANLFTTNTNFTKKLLVDLGCSPHKIHVLHMGTKLLQVTPHEPERNKKPTALLTVGRLSGEKGHRYALEAIHHLVKKGIKVCYLIVGDGPLREELQIRIKQLNLENSVHLLGKVSQEKLMSLYENSALFILPSISGSRGIEGQGVVLQEAQSAQIPVIASNVGGIPESFINNKTGFLVNEKDPEAIASKVEYLIKRPMERRRMGKAGREFVKREYDADQLANELIRLYKNSGK